MNKQEKISVWFARWLAMNYNLILNDENGYWYSKQYKHFIDVVYPKWVVEEKRQTV